MLCQLLRPSLYLSFLIFYTFHSFLLRVLLCVGAIFRDRETPVYGKDMKFDEETNTMQDGFINLAISLNIYIYIYIYIQTDQE